MGLFQKTVLKKHLLELNNSKIDAAYKRFTDYFHNPTIQNNIRKSKEEQFQEGFLRELFGHILNYTLNPNPEFNLTTELKNTTDSKKVDGAIVIDDIVRAVIELKGMDTTDLDKWVDYAFRYKNSHQDCTYVVLSNFEKLRFYIDNTIEYEEFNLFTLNREQFNLLYMCLSYDNIKHNVPKRLKAESVSQEDQITKKLYKDYSEFKRALFNNLVELNPQYDKLLLFKKTQKLLDRFLFIFFAEDRLLLPTNLIFRINQEWKNLQAMRIPVSLYERYMVYFNDLNHGAKVTLPAFGKKTGEAITAEFEIFAYNGGLFLPDEVLDNVKIDDTLLHTYSEKLSHYDFDSDVDVNILGHIFENSLNEIDEIKSEIEGEVIDRTKTRRKKDGVFYTPKYITKYIVDNTVGKLCEEKKAELKLKDEDYINDKKLQTKTKKALLDKLSDYRNYLLDLTICDPACGSGAFLNQALEFLITEHRYIDELQAKLMGDAMILSDVETSILENNIYGVDLNDESVEIAKLSLWLRTAQKGRKLNSLNNNIKCGNSLIDDPAVAGDKAFSWEKEFPEVFAKGGFDVVIGNPPYVRVQNLDHSTIDFYKGKYTVSHQRIDLYLLFFEKGFNLLNLKGRLSYINPTMFVNSDYGIGLRRYLAKTAIIEIVDFGDLPIFEDALTYTGIFTISRTKTETFQYVKFDTLDKVITNLEISDRKILNIKDLDENGWTFASGTETKLLKKLSKGTKLSEISIINSGCFTGLDEAFFVTDKEIIENELETDLIFPVIMGKEPKRYFLNEPIKKSIYPYINVDGKTELIGEDTLQLNYPNTYRYLTKFKEDLLNRMDSRKTFYEMGRPWYSYTRKGLIDVFQKEKILVGYIVNNNTYCLDKNKYMFSVGRVFGIVPYDPKISLGLLGVLNSKISLYQMQKKCPIKQGGFYKISSKYLSEFTVPSENSLKSIENLVGIILDINNQMNYLIDSIPQFLTNKFQLNKISVKLYNWYELSFNEFIDELKRQKIKLSLDEESEWLDFFNKKKNTLQEKTREIEQIDIDINRNVYQMYGLNEEEIKIVEG